MPPDDALYRFLTTRLRQQRVPVESLPATFGISRSTLYRNMKGTVAMSPKVRAGFADLLHLDIDERREFDRLSGLAAFDPMLIEARQVLDDIWIRRGPPAPPPVESVRFALYDGDTYLRTFDQVRGQIIAATTEPGATTQVLVVGCADGLAFSCVTALVAELLAAGTGVRVEHLLHWPNRDYAAMVTTVFGLVELMRFDDYVVRQVDQRAALTGLFGDAVLVDITGSQTCFLLSFIEDDLSTALVTTDAGVIAFLKTNSQAMTRGFPGTSIAATSPDCHGDEMAALEEGSKVCLLARTLCSDLVPRAVYDSLLSRVGPGEMAQVRQVLAGPEGDPATSLETMLAALDRRTLSSRTNQHVDVCSSAGLAEFARTGWIGDRVEGLPRFSPEERRVILEHARTRLYDPSDPCTLYVTRDDFAAGGVIVHAVERAGVVFEYGRPVTRRALRSTLFIDNPAMAEIFCDYARHHIPEVHALSGDQADVLLRGLIVSLT